MSDAPEEPVEEAAEDDDDGVEEAPEDADA